MAVRREQVIRTAEKYVSKGRIDAAIKEYRKVLDSHPGDVNTLNRLGDLYARIQRYDEAVQLFEQIAQGYTDDGFFVKAIAIYKKIIKLDPTRLEIYERLAELYHKQGLVNEARTQYQVLADYYSKHDNPTSAINVYRKMAEVEPDNPSHHAKLAELYTEQQFTDKAMAEYGTIANLMIEAGHPEDAVQVYRKALDVDHDIGFITDAAMRLKEGGHVAEAARFLAIAQERNPEAGKVARLVGMPSAEPEAEPEPTPEAAAPEPVEEPSAPKPEPTKDFASPASESEAVAEKPAEVPVAEEGPSAPALSDDLEDEGDEELIVVRTAADLPKLETEPPAELAVDAEGTEADLVVDLDEDLPAVDEVMVEAAAETGEDDSEIPERPPEVAAAGLPDAVGEIELDLDHVEDFTLDLEDEEPSPSLVQPPEDMMDGRPGAGFQKEEASSVPPAEIAETLEEADEEIELSSGVGEPTAPPVAALAIEEVAEEDDSGVDTDALEKTLAEMEPRDQAPPDENELISEAEVLAKYGMTDKAIERLREALKIQPKSVEAHAVLIDIHLETGRHSSLPELATRMRGLAQEQGDERFWPTTRKNLEAAGFRFGDATTDQDALEAAEAPGEFDLAEDVEPPKITPPPPKKKSSRVDRMLEDLLGQVSPRRRKARRAESTPEEVSEAMAESPTPPPREAPPEPSVDVPVDASALVPEGPLEEPPPEAVPSEVPLPEPPVLQVEEDEDDDIALGGIFNEVEVDDTPIPIPPAAVPPSAEPLPEEIPAALDPEAMEDSGTNWLDEAVQAREKQESGEAEIFQSEDDFFDLAGELEQELSDEEALEGGSLVESEEQTLEEIVEGFKQGVAENLSPEDHDTHFNLGIAYREMGLLDEAIGEFQIAAKSRRHLVECCSLLGLSFLEKGLPELAIKWYRQGLEAPDLTEEESLGLLYDLGNAQVALDDKEAARDTFVEIYGTNSNYRDVVAKLEELKQA